MSNPARPRAGEGEPPPGCVRVDYRSNPIRNEAMCCCYKCGEKNMLVREGARFRCRKTTECEDFVVKLQKQRLQARGGRF